MEELVKSHTNQIQHPNIANNSILLAQRTDNEVDEMHEDHQNAKRNTIENNCGLQTKGNQKLNKLLQISFI